MPITYRWSLAVSLLLPSLLLFSQSRSSTSPAAMDSLPSPFTISIDGATIAAVSGSGDAGPIHAEVGSNAAVFTLNGQKLQCGEWILARSDVEDRSMLPKRVLWFPAEAESKAQVKPVTAVQEGDGYDIQFGGKKLIAKDGKVFVELTGSPQSTVLVRMQQADN